MARRLVLERVCSYTEVTTTMSITDVEDMCIAADILHDAVNRKD